MPGFLDTMKYWFRMYKAPDGKKENEIALEGKILGREYVLFCFSPLSNLILDRLGRKELTVITRFATDLIHNCHQSWKTIITEEKPKHKSSLYVNYLFPTYLLLYSENFQTQPETKTNSFPEAISVSTTGRSPHTSARHTTRRALIRTRKRWISLISSQTARCEYLVLQALRVLWKFPRRCRQERRMDGRVVSYPLVE